MNKFSKVLLAVTVVLIGSMSIDNDKVHAMTQKDLAGKTYLINTMDENGNSEGVNNRRIAVVFNSKGTRYVSWVVETDGNGTITKALSKDEEKAQKGGKSLKKVSTKTNDDGDKSYYIRHGKKKDTIVDPLVGEPKTIRGDANKFSFSYDQDGAKKTREYTLANNPYQFNW